MNAKEAIELTKKSIIENKKEEKVWKIEKGKEKARLISLGRKDASVYLTKVYDTIKLFAKRGYRETTVFIDDTVYYSTYYLEGIEHGLSSILKTQKYKTFHNIRFNDNIRRDNCTRQTGYTLALTIKW